MIEKQNLFEARTNGYHTYRIPGIAVGLTIVHRQRIETAPELESATDIGNKKTQ